MPPTPPPPATPPEHPAPPPPSAPTGRPRHGLVLGLAAASVVPAVVLGGAANASAAPQRNPAATPATPLNPALAGSAPGSAASAVSAASAAGPPAAVTAAAAEQQPACGDPEAADFPIDTRIHGGPDTYASGGGYGTWFLDLTNTTSRACRSIHPVLVLTDEDRKLTSGQIQLKFSERAHPDVEHRVTWETTDRDEHIGVFGGTGDDAFEGFTVPAGRTVTVQVRLAFTSDTGPGRITANAAIVQRKHPAGGRSDSGTGDSGTAPKGSDGEWVGESEDYVFTVVEDGGGAGVDGDGTGRENDGGGEVRKGHESDGTGRENDGTAEEPGRLPDGARPSPRSSGAATGTPRPVAPGRDPAGVPELARTGIPVALPRPVLTVSGFLIGGGAMVAWSRRTRRTGR
uniref:Peptidase n=1 Tax=Streptomyces sp. NBC_00008 TaxID=2903610 RepID=A0AAU2VV86_9ACTN